MPSVAVDFSTVCLTLDLDWAPDHVLEDTRQLLQQAGLPATIFATHQSRGVTALLALPGCETGVHPNFLSDANEDAVLSRVLGAFPAAVGVRSHELYFDSRLLPLFQRKGVRYFSNDLMFLHSGLEPYYDWSGLVRLPLYWEDDVHCLFFDGRFDCAALRLDQPGLKVLNFHPVHLFLNTREIADYQAAKPVLADPVAARKLRREDPGIRTLFLEVVGRLRGTEMRTLGAVADEFRAAHVFEGRTAERFAQQARKERAP
jgi:hypothetical protein